MVFERFSRWSVGLYNRHFERPLFTSLPFIAVTLLFLVTLAREAWLLAGGAAATTSGNRVLFLVVVSMTPLMWLKGIVQHRQHRLVAAPVEASGYGGLSPAGAAAADYLSTATTGYLLLALVLGFVPR